MPNPHDDARTPNVEVVNSPLMPVYTASKESCLAGDNVALPLGDLAQTFSYNGDGTLNYAEVVYSGNIYRQTMTYTSGRLTGISQWVKQ